MRRAKVAINNEGVERGIEQNDEMFEGKGLDWLSVNLSPCLCVCAMLAGRDMAHQHHHRARRARGRDRERDERAGTAQSGRL